MRLGLSQVDLAERAEVTAAAISLYESGDRKPSFENLRKIARALGVDVDYLWGEVNSGKEVAAPKLRAAFRKAQNFDQPDQKFVADMIAKINQSYLLRKRKP
jgi:transcriptional regulator with XRE-family HTH domain